MINTTRVQSCWYCTFLNQPDCKDFFMLIEILVNQENENSSQILAERAG